MVPPRREVGWALRMKKPQASHLIAGMYESVEDLVGRGMMGATVARPALRYLGGKWRIAQWVASHFPEHRLYVEVFGGGASVLLRKRPSYVEVYNDAAGEVVNFFRVVRERVDELLEVLRLTPFAVDEYSDARHFPEGLGEVERARRFFVRSWQAQGGGVGDPRRSKGWRRTLVRPVAREFAAAAEGLSVVAQRLRDVQIDNLDWREVLSRYDSEETLFYLDPPYVHSSRSRYAGPSDGYGAHELSDEQHIEIIDLASRLKGAVVLSGYDSDIYQSAVPSSWTRYHKQTSRCLGVGHEALWVSKALQGALL